MILKLEHINIIDAIQYAVDKIVKQEYKSDDCSPRFTVSQLERFNEKGKLESHEILLTIEHSGLTKTRVLFPKLEYRFGYETLVDEMKYLYNSTM